MAIFKLTAAALLTALLSTPVQAFDGNKLHDACQKAKGSFESGFCMGYIVGVMESGGPPLFCPPDGITNFQYRDIVKKFLSEHPEKRHEHAVKLIWDELAEVFLCQ